MKKHTLLQLFVLFIIFSSCTSNSVNLDEQNQEELKKEHILGLFNKAEQLALGDKTVDKIQSFLIEDWGVCKTNNNTRNISLKNSKLDKFLDERQILEKDLDSFLIENPFELDSFVKEVSSPDFYKYYNNLLSTNNIENKATEIYNDNGLTTIEKSMLFLLMGSELNDNKIATRSISSCLKRYAKLTEISVKAAAISLVDLESGVDYATRELNRMGSEYDC